jgi:CBS domain-containing protein
MHTAELMSRDVSVVDLTTSVSDAAKMMQAHNTGCIVVTDDGALAGIITERDMVLGCLIDGHTSWQCQVYRHMTILNEAATLQTDVGDALLIMMDYEVGYLPVIDENRVVVGLLYAEDISRAIELDDDPIAILGSDLITV